MRPASRSLAGNDCIVCYRKAGLLVAVEETGNVPNDFHRSSRFEILHHRSPMSAECGKQIHKRSAPFANDRLDWRAAKGFVEDVLSSGKVTWYLEAK